MTLKFCSFASGSSGNCYLVKSNNTAILIDAGISGTRILAGLEDTETLREDISAVLVTHEHVDHVRSLPVLSKRIPGLCVYANEATWERIERPVPEERRRTFATGEDFQIGDLTIRPFPVPHDAAEPVGFSVFADGRQISVCTDAGYISEVQIASKRQMQTAQMHSRKTQIQKLMSQTPMPMRKLPEMKRSPMQMRRQMMLKRMFSREH